MTPLSVLALVLAGLLAGEEFIVRWGVAPALRTLPDPAHLRVRIALVRRLRVVVPVLIVPTVLTTAAVAVLAAPGPLAWAALGMVLVFVACSALGTVPINMQVIDWDPDDPRAPGAPPWPGGEALDVVRSSTAIAAFALLSAALV